MAVADIFSLRVDFEMPTGAASINFHFQETDEPSSLGETEGLAKGFTNVHVPLLVELLSNQCAATQVSVYKKAVIKTAPYKQSANEQIGQIDSPALPAFNGLKIGLLQAFFASASNGMIWIPGIPESQVLISTVDATYLDGVVKDFTDALLAGVDEFGGGDGTWRLVVISRKYLAANPGDWVGAAADVTGVTRPTTIGRQIRRRTKVRGGSPSTLAI